MHLHDTVFDHHDPGWYLDSSENQAESVCNSFEVFSMSKTDFGECTDSDALHPLCAPWNKACCPSSLPDQPVDAEIC